MPRAAAAPRVKPPVIREMAEASCLALLRRNAVGRVAFCFHDRVSIEPIHYVYANGWLFARTSYGQKMETIEHMPWVAFEVDEIEDTFTWKSVVVQGTIYRMEHDGGPIETSLRERGVKLLQRIVPGTGTENDPVAFRTLVFGIHVNSLTGRSCRPTSR